MLDNPQLLPSVSNIVIAVDFDGTIVQHEFPDIGKPILEAFQWLYEFQKAGADLILYTMRDKDYLVAAIDFCKEYGIHFNSCNFNPTQPLWTTSPKCYAHIYIDDAAIGCPLIYHTEECGWEFDRCNCNIRPYVDWQEVGPMVMEKIEAWKNGTFYGKGRGSKKVYVRTNNT